MIPSAEPFALTVRDISPEEYELLGHAAFFRDVSIKEFVLQLIHTAAEDETERLRKRSEAIRAYDSAPDRLRLEGDSVTEIRAARNAMGGAWL